MSRARSHGMTRGRLRWTLGTLFLALAIPSAVLVVQTQRQLKWESFHQNRQLAVELADRIDARLQQLVATEEARGYADYTFLNVTSLNAATDPAIEALLQRSPLARFPVQSDIPGLLGWFQIDAEGGFSSPLLPQQDGRFEELGLTKEEVAARQALADSLQDVLGRNQLVVKRRAATLQVAAATSKDERQNSPSPITAAVESRLGRSDAASATAAAASPPPAQVAFDQLNQAQAGPRAQEAKALGKVTDLNLANAYAERDEYLQEELRQDKQKLALPQRGRRVEQAALPTFAAKEQAATVTSENPASAREAELLDAKVSLRDSVLTAAPLRMFDSELDPFEIAQLGSGHFVLFRRVWRNGERSIQGALIEQDAFLRGMIDQPFAGSVVSPVSDLLVAWQGDVLQRFDGRRGRLHDQQADELTGTLLHRARLSAPLADMELIWTIRRLPTSPGLSLVAWAGVVLFGVLMAGFFTLYRLGLKQLGLASQQQDFIAAVSHELKTPLTSIRMYGELLRAGWASEEKRREYYDYIFHESERLSRLIANVLQLARLERDELRLELKPQAVATLFDVIRSKVHGQIERAGFEVSFDLDQECAKVELSVDTDALVQVMINLVDNALKFSAKADVKRIEISVAAVDKNRIAFAVRDHGPGVPAALRKRIFELFFRAGNELTRETQGTGIGLALVRQLAHGMHGEVDVQARDPGVEFRLLLMA
ncbi:MAG: sensor histidine kinase [Pseudomarimonas sp.]